MQNPQWASVSPHFIILTLHSSSGYQGLHVCITVQRLLSPRRTLHTYSPWIHPKSNALSCARKAWLCTPVLMASRTASVF